MINVEECTKGIEKQRTKNHIVCQECGKFFLHKKKGRKPTACAWYKKQEQKEKRETKKQNEEMKKQKDVIAVHDLNPIYSVDEVYEGMMVYHKPKLFSNEKNNQLFASEYKIIDISGEDVTILRNAQANYKKYPVTTKATNLHKSVGKTYVRKEEHNNE